MELAHGRHLAYCTNIHRGEDWEETFAGLGSTLRVRKAVCPGERFGIGLRLSARAAAELGAGRRLADFRHWLDRHDCYVFTINGFPYGQFHGAKIKESVYKPDWSRRERLEYTCQLFDLLSELVGPGGEGSVSTCPGSYKGFRLSAAEERAMIENLHACMRHIGSLCERRDQDLHLGLEPEPLGYIETSTETVAFLQRLLSAFPADEAALRRCIGVNYDTCHLATEYESATEALERFRRNGFRVSKLHLSSALRLQPTPDNRALLRPFADDIYLHQVVVRHAGGRLECIVDLPEALAAADRDPKFCGEEWRVHFHIPLHHEPVGGLGSTRDHIIEVFDLLAAGSNLCRHLEMETYTWEVLPASMRDRSVVEQLVCEYRWCLAELERRNLGSPAWVC